MSATAPATTPSKTVPESKLDGGQVEDHLEVDAPIPGQQYVCLSFVSPEKVLPQKDAYFRTEFWKYLKDNHEAIDFNVIENLEDLYATFIDQAETILEEKFHAAQDFQTTVRGLKVRGVYNTMREAEVRSKVLQKLDSHHHVFVAPVGYWLPWDPAADAVQDQVYQEEQLNDLMRNYKQNEMKRDEYYAEQKNDRMKKAMEENAARKKANEAEEAAEGAGDGEAEESKASDAETLFEAVESQADHASLKDGFEAFKGGSGEA
jgi:hypothetical protein